MTKEELGIAIDSAFSTDTLEETDRLKQERELFRRSVLLQPEVSGLDRTPSSYQVKQSWERWKRERKLDAYSDKTDITGLYTPKAKRKK